MKHQSLPTLSALLPLLRPATAIHANSVESDSWSCDASRGIDISFTPAPEHHQILVSFPTIALTVQPPAHGYPGGASNVGCSALVGFVDFAPQRRFAVANATWRADNGVDLPADAELYRLTAKVEYRIERDMGTFPRKYPIVKDLSSAVLLDLDLDPKLSDEARQGKFEYFAENPNRVWTECKNGYEGNVTKMYFGLSGHTRKGGTSLPGWSMDLGLVWEDCYPPDDVGWGQTIINGWESCTYSNVNRTSRGLLPDVFRKNRKD
ncbi:uncharacterized protein PG986_004756 [Apiospora aurea]|uniref:Uncharacterized protein n=1 Tax=Apiospora aurea TaxID=335848 RepID=A0ABR1QNI2_9PEZI